MFLGARAGCWLINTIIKWLCTACLMEPGVDINSKSDGRRTPKPLSDYLGATGNQDDEEADEEELPQLHQEQKRGV